MPTDGESRAGTAAAILIADDHPLFRGALRGALHGVREPLLLAEASSFDDIARRLAAGEDFDLLLLDLNMPGMRGFAGLTYLRAQYPALPILVVSAVDDPTVIRRCLDFGALGFLPKTSTLDEMRRAVDTVLAGGRWTPAGFDAEAVRDDGTGEIVRRLSTLTPQQVRVLMMLAEGLLNKQIAYELDVSEATIKAHVSAILTKLDVESRTQAVIALARVEPDQWRPDVRTAAAGAAEGA